MPFIVSSIVDKDESAIADNAEVPAKKRKRLTCYMAKYNMCSDASCTSTDMFTEEDIMHFFGLNGDNDIDMTLSKDIDLCQTHYKTLQNLKATCSMCLSRKRQVRQMSKEKCDLLRLYRNAEKLDIKIYKKSYICVNCLKRLLGFESSDTMKQKTLEVIMDIYSRKKKETQCTGSGGSESALIEIVLYVGQLFGMKRASLFSTVYKVYKDSVAKCHPESGLNYKLLNQKKLEEFLQDTFGDNLKLTVVDGETRLGTMMQWKQNDTDETLHKLLFQQTCKDQKVQDIYMYDDTTKVSKTESISSTSTSATTSHGNDEDDVINVLERCLVILRSKVKVMVDKIDESDVSGHIDLTTINLERFLLEFCDPLLWNFYLQLSLSDNETRNLKKEDFIWSKHFVTTLRSNETLHARLYLLSVVNFIYTSGKTRYPYHLAIADVVDKYSNSSKKCMSFLNALGISVSKDSLQRHKTDIAAKSMQLRILDRIRPGSFFTVSIDNINVRVPHERVRFDSEKRGFDGTSIQVTQPKPDTLLLTESELSEFERQSLSSDNFNYVLVPSLKDNFSFYRSICRHFFKDLIKMETLESDHNSYVNVNFHETACASALQVQLNEDLTDANCLLLDSAFDKTVNMKDWPSTVSQHCVSVMQRTEKVGYPEFLSFVRLTGVPLFIYEEIDGVLKPCVKILEHMADKVQPVSLLRNGGYYDTILDCKSYFMSFDIDHDVVGSIQRNNVYYNNVNKDSALNYESLVNYTNCNNDEEICQTACKRPIRRSLDEKAIPCQQIVQFKGSGICASTATTHNLKIEDLLLSSEHESKAFKDFEKQLFTFIYSKFRYTLSIEDPKVTIPGLKVYFSKQRPPTTERSLFTYYSIKNLNSDSKECLLEMISELYKEFQINERFRFLILVGDGKVFEHLVKIKDEYGSNMDWLLPFIGDWHCLVNYARHIFKIYGTLGLNSLVMKSHRGHVANTVLLGTNFDRTYNFILQVWEALYRWQIEVFLKYRKDGQGSLHTDFDKVISEIALDLSKREDCFETLSVKIQEFSDKLNGLQSEFQTYNEELCEVNENYRIWHKFIHIDCANYIGFFIAFRTGDWNLRNACLKAMTQIFHVTESKFYRKLLPLHLRDLHTFPPAVLDHFKGGGWVANMKGHNTANIALDEAHETLINKDMKEVISGISLKRINENMHYHSYRANSHTNIINQVMPKSENYSHKEDSVTFINDFESLVNGYKASVKDVALFVPDSDGNSDNMSNGKLRHLITGELAGTLEREDLLNIHRKGEANMKTYLECNVFKVYHGKTLSQRKFHSFGSNKGKKSSKPVHFYKDKSLQVLKRSINWATAHGTNPGEIKALCPLPIAICEYDGTPYKSSKSKAVGYFRKNYKESFIKGFLPEEIEINAVVIEGMFAINCRPWQAHRHFEDYANFIFNNWVSKWFSSKFKQDVLEVHIVFDYQDVTITTPKYFERKSRDEGHKASEFDKVDNTVSLPTNWTLFLKCRKNKKLLVNYLSEKLLEIGKQVLVGNQILFVSGGFLEQGVAKQVANGRIEEKVTLKNNHIEGDTLVFLHAVRSECINVLIYSPDSDVFFIGLTLAEKYPHKNFTIQLSESSYDKEYFNLSSFCKIIKDNVDVKDIVKEDIASTLQALFICTGCDYISFFRSHSKVNFLTTFFKHATFISGGSNNLETKLAHLSHTEENDGLMSFYRLVGCEYMKGLMAAFDTDIKSPEDLFEKFSQPENSTLKNHQDFLARIRTASLHGNISEEKCLISSDALRLHWSRCCYVSKVWQQADSLLIQYPELEQHGWQVEGNTLNVVWDSKETQKDLTVFLDMMFTGCSCCSPKRLCSGRCGCKSKGLGCRQACRCQGKCNNAPIDPSPQLIFQQMLDYYNRCAVNSGSSTSTDNLMVVQTTDVIPFEHITSEAVLQEIGGQELEESDSESDSESEEMEIDLRDIIDHDYNMNNEDFDSDENNSIMWDTVLF